MPTPKACPFCGSPKVLSGEIKVSEGLYGFRPTHSREGIHALLDPDTFASDPRPNSAQHARWFGRKPTPKPPPSFYRSAPHPPSKHGCARQPRHQAKTDLYFARH